MAIIESRGAGLRYVTGTILALIVGGEIGGGLRQYVGRVGNGDPQPPGAGQIDVVCADGHIGHDFEPIAPLEQPRVHPVGEQAEERVNPAHLESLHADLEARPLQKAQARLRYGGAHADAGAAHRPSKAAWHSIADSVAKAWILPRVSKSDHRPSPSYALSAFDRDAGVRLV